MILRLKYRLSFLLWSFKQHKGFKKPFKSSHLNAVTGNEAAEVLIHGEFGLRSLEGIQKDTWGVTSIYSWLQQSGLWCYGESAEQRKGRKRKGREARGMLYLKPSTYYSLAQKVNVCDSIVTQFLIIQHNFSWSCLFSREASDDPLISLSPCPDHLCVVDASARSRTRRFVLCLRQSKGDRDDTITRMTHPFKLGIKTAIYICQPKVNLF